MATHPQPSTSSSNAFSFLSKGWREVRDSADADLRLMQDRANSLKDLATSFDFDSKIEHFFNSAPPPFSVPAMRSPPPREIEFVKSLQPKLTEIKRAYSSPDFSKKVLEKWRPKTRIRIDLSAITKPMVMASEEEEEEEEDGVVGFWSGKRGKRLSFWNELKGEGEGESKDWEPIRKLKTRLKEFEKRGSSFEAFKNSEFMEKVKASLVCASSSFSNLLRFYL